MLRRTIKFSETRRMDPLTHTLTGLFLSRAGLNRFTPRASAILMLAANAPDIDIVTATGGSLNYLHYHRHLTHSLAAMPVMAMLPLLLVRGVSRKPVHWLGAYFAALIAVGSHLLLDWTNSYGIRLLLPFSGRWLRLDWTNVIDVWIWAVLLLGVAGPFLARLVGSEIGSGPVRQPYPGRGFAVFALGFLLLYNFGRGTLHGPRCSGAPNQNLRRIGAVARRCPAQRRQSLGLARSGRNPRVLCRRGLEPGAAVRPHPRPNLPQARPRPRHGGRRPLPDLPAIPGLLPIPKRRVTPADEPENSNLVEAMDMRFGSPLAPGFIAGALVDSRLRVLRTWFQFGAIRPR